tara:strand:- start:279 stop:632 length:354 start_codon:yes stop_codon:yes gene_type:complete
MLKSKWCTVQFNAFLQEKMPTQVIKGGNTDELYQVDDKPKNGERYSKTGTVDKSKMMITTHPDISTIVHRFGRIHHHVNYGPFKKNKLIRKKSAEISPGTNNYGMGLVVSKQPHNPA